MNTDEIDKLLVDISRDMDLEIRKGKKPTVNFIVDLLLVLAVYGFCIFAILALANIVINWLSA